QHLRAEGANTVQINPFLVVQRQTSSHIITAGDPAADPTNFFNPPSDALTQQVIDAFKSAGLNIELKISLETYDRTFSGSLAPANVDQWFSKYKAAVLDYARLAQANGITKLIITNELESMTSQYRDKWLDIIDAVRQVYTGEIGVNAVPHESLNLSFGDK